MVFEDLYNDVTYGFKVSKVLVPEANTGIQKIMILDTERLGRVLILDGIVQLTEEDEGIYHEWITHWPLFSLDKTGKNVLIIGGGDGGVAREVLRHRSVKNLTMVEIDRMVVDKCREYLHSLSEGVWDDPRFKLLIGDGAEALRSLKDKFDVIIIDSIDPIGPAKSFFSTEFYQSVYDSLKDGGIAVHQTGSLILQPSECPGSWRQIERSFDDILVMQFSNVSYMGGPFSLTAGSKGRNVFQKAVQNSKKVYKKSGIKCSWYSPNIPAIVYPEFQKRMEQDKYGEEVIMDIELRNNKIPPVEKVTEWSRQTCEAINMRAFGTPLVSKQEFGEGDTLVQYVETSAINYRQYGSNGCAYLPVNDAVKYSLGYFGAIKGAFWHIPRGSFAGLSEIRKHSLIYMAELSQNGNNLKHTDKIYRAKLINCMEVLTGNFKLSVEEGFSPAFELIIDLYNCDYRTISSSTAVAKWASLDLCKAAGLKPLGKADAPDFGHAKKKTSGPSVTQFLKHGSNISHYSENWLMILINIVSAKPFSIREVLASAFKYFKGERAVCWLLPRGCGGKNLKRIAEKTLIFEVMKKDLE